MLCWPMYYAMSDRLALCLNANYATPFCNPLYVMESAYVAGWQP